MAAISTLGEAHDRGWRLRLVCRGGKGEAMKKHRACVASIGVDLELLLWTHGRECDVVWLARHLKCPRCNSRSVGMYFEPPAGEAKATARA